MPTNIESGRDYLTRVIAALPEDRRAQVQSLLLDDAAAPALDVAGQGAKRQDDYSRAMDDLRAREARATADLQRAEALARQAREVEAQQVAWWEENRAALERATATPAPTPTPAPAAPTPSNVVTRDFFDTTANEFLGVVAWSNQKAIEHYQKFGEALDVNGLIGEARQKKCSLEEAYQAKFKPRYDELATKAQQERDAEIARKAVDEFRAQNPNIPYPVPSRASADTLAGLKTDDRSQYGPEAAAAEYNRLVAARGASA